MKVLFLLSFLHVYNDLTMSIHVSLSNRSETKGVSEIEYGHEEPNVTARNLTSTEITEGYFYTRDLSANDSYENSNETITVTSGSNLKGGSLFMSENDATETTVGQYLTTHKYDLTNFTWIESISSGNLFAYHHDIQPEKNSNFKTIPSATNISDNEQSTESYISSEGTIFEDSSNYDKEGNTTANHLEVNEMGEFGSTTENYISNNITEIESSEFTNGNGPEGNSSTDQAYIPTTDYLQLLPENWNSSNIYKERLVTVTSLTEKVENNTGTKTFPVRCAKVISENFTIVFKAYLEAKTINANEKEVFQLYLQKYFPYNACNLIVMSVSNMSVMWTDLSVDRSGFCSELYRKQYLHGMVNEKGLVREFHKFFLPAFDIKFVNWSSAVQCVVSRSSARMLNVMDITVYVFGGLLILGIIMVLTVFLRGQTYKSHNMDVNATPNTYQKYTLRGRQPAFLSPELHRPSTMATCNPAYVDDETVEPRAKCFMETV